MTSHTFKARKISKNIAASKKKGAETRAANVRAAGEQKRVALEKGGRFSEGGTISTVTFRGTSSTPISGKERAQALFDKFSRGEFAKSDSEFSGFLKSQGGSTTIERTQSETETDAFAFDEEGEVSAPPLKQKPLVSKEESNFDNLLGKEIKPQPKTKLSLEPLINRGLQEPIQAGVKDFALNVASIGVALKTAGAETIKSGDIKLGFEKGSKEAIKFVEAHRDPEFEPFSVKDIARKGAETVSFAAVAGATSGGLGGVSGVGQTISRGIKVSKVEKLVKESGIVSGKEKLSPTDFLISKGTETNPAQVPFTRVRFGKKGTTVQEVTPGSKTLSPSEIIIRGKLDPSFQNILEAKQIDKFIFKSSDPSAVGRSAFAKGTIQGGIKPIAEGRTAPLKDVLKGKPENLLKASKKPKSVFAETQAEKTIFPKNQNVLDLAGIAKKPTKPFSLEPSSPSKGGAGQEVQIFSKSETKTLKNIFKSEAKQTTSPKQDPLGFVILPGSQATQQEEQIIKHPPQTPLIITDLEKKKPSSGLIVPFVTIPTTTQEKKQGVTPALIPPVTKNIIEVVPKIPTILIPPTTIPIITQVPKQPQRIITETRIDTPVFPEITLTPPPLTSSILKPPPVAPPKIPIAFGLPPPIASRDFDTPSELLGSTKGFRGNVTVDSIIGIVRKAPTIEVTEKPGFKIRQFKQKKENNILGGNIKIGLGSTKKQKGKSRKTKSKGLGLLGSGKSLKLFGKSKGLKIRF